MSISTLRGWFEYFKHSHQMDLSLHGSVDTPASCGVSCAGARIERESVEDSIISAGLTHSFGHMGFSALQMPIELYSSPLGGKTTDRRAG